MAGLPHSATSLWTQVRILSVLFASNSSGTLFLGGWSNRFSTFVVTVQFPTHICRALASFRGVSF
eukprot:2088336-Prorocentrum_lima.AAC.1